MPTRAQTLAPRWAALPVEPTAASAARPRPTRGGVAGQAGRPGRAWPWVTGLIAALCLAVPAWPGASAAIALQPPGSPGFHFWQLWTGHLTHWDGSHLAWDGLAFVLLAGWLETRSRSRLLLLLAVGLPLLGTGVFLWRPDLASYRGLSGLDTALFVALLLDLGRPRPAVAAPADAASAATVPTPAEPVAPTRPTPRGAMEPKGGSAGRTRLGARLVGRWGLVPAVLLLGKLAYEAASGSALFCTDLPAGVEPLVEAHLLGLALGVAASLRAPARRGAANSKLQN